jgi:lipopolysaccharide/colanic/teichoic acid biosynthesis glycosyltransferase
MASEGPPDVRPGGRPRSGAPTGPQRRRGPWLVKRAVDVLGSALGLVALSPVLLVLATMIRSRLGTPVLFTQVRPGLRGRPFTIYKFRTMLDASDAHGRPLPDEERLTPFGRALRSSSLDELPELVNVLKGDMSLVGPRPLIMDYLDRYTPEQARRMEVPPGITGLAQVEGRNAVSWEERFRLDVEYVDTWSLWLDASILWRTLRIVVAREGISAEGHATMPPFEGTRRDASTRPAPAGSDSDAAAQHEQRS